MIQVIIRWLTIATVAALIALILYAGSPTDRDWWLGAIPFTAWIISPTVAAYGLSRRFRHRSWFPSLMLAFLIGSAIVLGIGYYQAFFVSTSSTSALALVMGPLFQWLALAGLGIISAGAVFWRNRRAGREA